MSINIELRDQFISVSNQRFNTLLSFVLDVAGSTSATAEEREYLCRLTRWYEQEHFPGCIFDMDELFPTPEEKRFWARCFQDVARRMFLRELGNHGIDDWQPSAIGDAYITSRVLMSAVYADERRASTLDMRGKLNQDEGEGPINVHL